MAANVGLVPARFENVNLLRAFAALSVVVYHVIMHTKLTSSPESGPLVLTLLAYLALVAPAWNVRMWALQLATQGSD